MSKAKAPRVFVPLTKVDEEQRLVYGRITQELLDKAGEVMDYETSKPLFQKWSDEIHTNSGGLSKGNVRVMHGLTAAGKLTELEFDDDEKAIDVCAKIVDDKEWEKVTEGVYTGFSVGGKYEKRWTETGDGGAKIKKFTANPNEVSIVDNPCVPSACFTMFKADGAEEQVEFKVENDDEAWPDFAKADSSDEAVPEEKDPKAEKKGGAKKPAKKTDAKKAAAPAAPVIPNDVLVKKAEELAKAAGDGTTWQDHLDAARAELTKAATGGEAEEGVEESGDATEGAEETGEEEGAADEGAEEEAADDDSEEDGKAEKVTPPGVKQQWTCSDGSAFDKKADAEAHEETLQKAAEPKSEADKLRERMNKALTVETPEETGLMEDFDRLGKVFQALDTPHDENGAPKLEKGMYTVSRFANVLWDLGALQRSIKKEGKKEDGDEVDYSVSDDIKAAIASLGESMKTYLDDQLTELLAGLDDEVCVSYYDYYYCAAQENGEDQLAKDICSVLEERKDPSRERREELAKSFGYVEGELEVTEIDDEDLPPNLAKRFEKIESERDEFKKVAEEAIEKIETLTKKVDDLGEQPAPRAPRNVALRDGDMGFFKGANSEEEKLAMLSDMVKQKGAEGVALDFIKLAQQNGQQLHLRR